MQGCYVPIAKHKRELICKTANMEGENISICLSLQSLNTGLHRFLLIAKLQGNSSKRKASREGKFPLFSLSSPRLGPHLVTSVGCNECSLFSAPGSNMYLYICKTRKHISTQSLYKLLCHIKYIFCLNTIYFSRNHL